MPIQDINLGAAVTGVGGDTYREANSKTNTNFDLVGANLTALDTKDKAQDVVINKATSDITAVNTLVNDNKTVINDRVDQEVNALKSKDTLQDGLISNNKIDITALKTKTDTTNVRVTALEGINTTNIPKLTSVISESATNKSGITTLNTKTDTTNTKVTALESINTTNIPKLTAVIAESGLNKTAIATANALINTNNSAVNTKIDVALVPLQTKVLANENSITVINTNIGNVKSILDSLNGVVV